MTTASPEVADRRTDRLARRDGELANTDTPPPIGDTSSVSQDALTKNAHDYAATRTGAPALSDDLQRSTNAATLPPGPGRANGASDGARSRIGQPDTGQKQKKDPHTR